MPLEGAHLSPFNEASLLPRSNIIDEESVPMSKPTGNLVFPVLPLRALCFP